MSTRFYIPVATIAIDTECCHAFLEGVDAIDQGPVVGSRVLNHHDFLMHVTHAIKAHDFSRDRITGQGFLSLPKTVFEHVSAGDGEHTNNLDDYVIAKHRGRCDAYLKREHAGTTTFCAAVVYTREAYLADPEVNVSLRDGVEHVIVAVLAGSGPESPLPLYTLINNLAGGNKEALDWSVEEIRAKAKATKEYWDKYSLVAG